MDLGSAHDTTGLDLWPAAASMFCTYLHNNMDDVRGRSVRELGAGTGLGAMFTSVRSDDPALPLRQSAWLVR